MITYAVLGLLAIVALVFCILSAKTSKILHVMLMFVVFVAMGACVIFMSAAVRTRIDWVKQYNETLDKLETEKAKYRQALYGDADEIELKRNSLLGIETILDIELTGQGRVWRNTKPAVAGPNSVTITFGPGASSQIENDMLLYVFKEKGVTVKNSDTPVRVATDYVGAVLVTNVADDTVTAKGQFIADTAAFTDADAMQSVRWTVFEKMPIDPTDSLLRAVYDEPFDPANPPANINFDVDTHVKLMRDKFKELFAKPDSLTDTEYESLVDDYAFEGMKLTDINAWLQKNGNGRKFDKGQDERYYHLTIKDKQTIKVQVDNTDDSNTLNNRSAIDPNTGLAVNPTLKAGTDDGVATLKAKESGYFSVRACDEGADGLVKMSPLNPNGGVATIDYEVYRRAIVDIPARIQKIRENTTDLELRTIDWRENIKLVTKSNELLNAQINLKQKHVRELSSDNVNLNKDRESVETLRSELDEEVRNTMQRINDLYADIRQKHQLLEKYNKMLLEKEAENRK